MSQFKQIEISISILPFKVKAYRNMETGQVQIDADDLCHKLGCSRIQMDGIALNLNALGRIPECDVVKRSESR